MDYGTHAGTHLINRFVEGVLRRGFVRTDNGTIRFHTDDVLFGQRTFVNRTRGNPHVAIVVHDRDVTARCGRHATAIDTADDHRNLFGRMHQLGV